MVVDHLETPSPPAVPPPYRIVSIRYLASRLHIAPEHLKEVAANAGSYYAPFDIPKGEGASRHIDEPKGPLRDIQERINKYLLRSIRLPEGMLGGVKGRSLRDNALIHVRQPDLVTIDLRDCFPRTSNRAVYRAFVEEVGCSPTIASLLTKLTTYHRRLPQGAPTSSTLANLTLLPMYRDLEALAQRRGLRMSFWVDDIAFSGAGAREALTEALLIVHKHHHAVRRKKIRRMHGGKMQTITKVGVNRLPSASKKRRRDIQREILALSKSERVTDRAHQSVRGKIEFVRSINPTQGAALDRLAARRLPAPNDKDVKPKLDKVGCPGAHTHRKKPPRPGQPPRRKA